VSDAHRSSVGQREPNLDGEAKHRAAVARSLGWADDSAARGDHGGALGWLQMVEAIGDQLPEAYETRRRDWLIAVRTGGAAQPPG
jgi:hypothetical protein